MTTALELMDQIVAAHWRIPAWEMTPRKANLVLAIAAADDAYDDWRVAGCPRRGPVFERLLSTRTTLSLHRGM